VGSGPLPPCRQLDNGDDGDGNGNDDAATQTDHRVDRQLVCHTRADSTQCYHFHGLSGCNMPNIEGKAKVKSTFKFLTLLSLEFKVHITSRQTCLELEPW